MDGYSPGRRVAAGVLAAALLPLVANCTGGNSGDRASDTDEPDKDASLSAASPSLKDETHKPSLARDPIDWGPTRGERRRALHIAESMTLPELAGGVIVASYSGSRAPTRLVNRLDLGGVIVSGTDNTSVAAQGRANHQLQRAADRPWPLVIAVDQEGGRVTRLGPPMTQFPTYMSLGAADRASMARRVAETTGQELRAAGFTMVFAPVADVTMGSSDTAIGSRSAGSDPERVAALVASSTRGFTRAGIVPVVKHFPGHGSVRVDSHVGLPRQRHPLRWLQRRDFKPFAAAIAAHVPAVMVGHIAVSRLDRAVPADLSTAVIGVLRRGLRFGGVVVSDSLQMAAVSDRYGPAKAAVTALRAGVDVVLMPQDPERARAAIIAAVRTGDLDRDRLETSVARLGAVMLHQRHAAPPRASLHGAGEDLAYRVSASAVTVVAGPCSGPYVARRVTPVGPRYLVDGFNSAARAAGLRIGRGPRVLLLDDDARVRPAAIAVSVDVPYRLTSSHSATKLALFGSTPQAWQVLVDVLSGARTAHGHIPVPIHPPAKSCP